MSDLAASGGYYIAAPADEIWASPATITGSIGIFAIIPTVQRTLEKIGVHVDGVGTTPLSGQLRLDRPLGEEREDAAAIDGVARLSRIPGAGGERTPQERCRDRCDRAGARVVGRRGASVSGWSISSARSMMR